MSDYDWHIIFKKGKNKNIAIFYDDPYPFFKGYKISDTVCTYMLWSINIKLKQITNNLMIIIYF